MSQEIPLALSYDDVLLVPQYSRVNSRRDVDLSIQISPRIKLKLPLTSAPMSDVTGVKLAIKLAKLGGLGFLHRFTTENEQADMVRKVKKNNVIVGAAVGCREENLSRAEKLVKAGVDVLLLDVTHGHMQKAIDVTRKLKSTFGKDVDIMAGLVATGEGAENLFKAGADCVHVGIGGGSICLTRINAGVGVPNITTIFETSRVARKYKKTIIIDGGIKNSGDIVKALAAGAHAVRSGFIFAGTNESPGKLVNTKKGKYKVYKASTSFKEKKNHIRKKIVKDSNYINHIEGVESTVPYKGKLEKVVTEIQAGLRAGLSYCGARNIQELWKKARFIQITQSGVRESGAHDVIVETSSLL